MDGGEEDDANDGDATTTTNYHRRLEDDDSLPPHTLSFDLHTFPRLISIRFRFLNLLLCSNLHAIN